MSERSARSRPYKSTGAEREGSSWNANVAEGGAPHGKALATEAEYAIDVGDVEHGQWQNPFLERILTRLRLKREFSFTE